MTVRELLKAYTGGYTDVVIYTNDNEEILEGKNMVCNVLTNPFYAYILDANVIAWDVHGERTPLLIIRTDYEYESTKKHIIINFDIDTETAVVENFSMEQYICTDGHDNRFTAPIVKITEGQSVYSMCDAIRINVPLECE